MINNISVIKVGSYIKFINLIKNISRDIPGKVPYYSYPSSSFMDSFPDVALETCVYAPFFYQFRHFPILRDGAKGYSF